MMLTRFSARAKLASEQRLAVWGVHDIERLLAEADEDVAVGEHLDGALAGAGIPV